MPENLPKIEQAEIVSKAVVDHWNVAQDALRICYVNGYGVLTDPGQAADRLYRAREAIDHALAAMRGCEWPRAEDYPE